MKKILALLIVLLMVASCLFVAGTVAAHKDGHGKGGVSSDELNDMENFKADKERKGDAKDSPIGIKTGMEIKQITPAAGALAGTTIRRLTTDPADDGSPLWSPDGKTIVFMSDRTGYKDIYKVNVDGTGLTRLTTYGDCDHFPVFTPDGSKIIFGRYGDGHGEVWMMNQNGTGQVEISPTGDSICRGKRIDCTNDKVVYRHDTSSLWVLDRTTGVETQLVPIGSGRNKEYIKCSPDGSKILTSDGFYYFSVINTNGTGYQQLEDSVLGEEVKWFDWGPTGTEVCYVSNCVGDNGNLRTVNINGTSRSPYIVTTEDNCCIRECDWGSSGWITYVYGCWGEEIYKDSIWITSPDGSEQHQLTSDFDWPGHSQPTFSPDGSKIVFVAEVDENEDIYVIDLAPSKVPTLTPIGIVALVGLLSVIVAISIRRKRKG